MSWRSQLGSITPLYSFPVSGAPLRNVVAVGHFLPAGGTQIAVSTQSDDVVLIDELTGQERLRLHGPATFGSALAVKPGHFGVNSVDALFVGVPGESRVVLMVGDAGVGNWPGPASYGAAVAWAEPQRRLYVGAPRFDGGGAVFYETTFANNTPVGDVVECDVNAPCVPPAGSANGCATGSCVGGVFCRPDILSECPLGMTCVSDGSPHCAAGAPDAGSNDAGSNDAGSNDAGSNDAGSNDAGSDDAGGSNDAGSSDAGSDDAGSSDAGSSDAGSNDAGSSDAGSNDAGSSDAGSNDAGSNDAGSSDAGSNDAGDVTFRTSGCAELPLTSPYGLIALLALRRRTRGS